MKQQRQLLSKAHATLSKPRGELYGCGIAEKGEDPREYIYLYKLTLQSGDHTETHVD
jgi:hypothetical protein